MPQAKPPFPDQTPATLSDEEAVLIKSAVARVFGPGAVVRNYGADPARLGLHVEADDISQSRIDELLGFLYAKIDRHTIGVDFTKRRSGVRISGSTKIAYRQGVIL